MNQSKSKVICKKQNLELLSAQLFNNRLAEQNKRKEILELQKYVFDQRDKFRSALFTLKSKLQEWVQQYLIVAPEQGKILFISFLQENQTVTRGQELFFVQPDQITYYGQMVVSQAGLGKVRTGQKVIIRVASYPSNEFGYLRGNVNYISNMPTATDSFLLRVNLPNALITNYNKELHFRNSLTSQGEILTDNRRLLERFLGEIIDVFKRQQD